MTYGRLEDTLADNVKIDRLARTLKVRRAEAVGLLATLWSKSLTQAPDGDLTDLRPNEVEKFAGWEGAEGDLWRALQEPDHCFLDRDEHDRLIIHDWDDHAEGLKRAEQKRRERERKTTRRRQVADSRATAASRDAAKFESVATISPDLDTLESCRTTVVDASALARARGASDHERSRAIANIRERSGASAATDASQTTTPATEGPDAAPPGERVTEGGSPSRPPEASQDAWGDPLEFDRLAADIAAAQHEVAPKLAPPRPLAARDKENLESALKTSPERLLIAWWRGLFQRANASKFLTEKHRHAPISLSWLLEPRNLKAFLDGRYDDTADEQPKRQRAPPAEPTPPHYRPLRTEEL